LGLRGKIPTKMLRQLIFNFHPKKRAKIPLFRPLKMAITKKPLSVWAEILRVILRKIVQGLDGKNSTKDAQKVEFQFSLKNRQKIPILDPFKPLLFPKN
jgi:hypothetical protein